MADMSQQTLPDMPSVPTRPAGGRPVARSTDPVTSHEVIRWFGINRWPGSDSGIRTRLNEAVSDGRLRISDEMGESPHGRRAQQYETAK